MISRPIDVGIDQINTHPQDEQAGRDSLALTLKRFFETEDVLV